MNPRTIQGKLLLLVTASFGLLTVGIIIGFGSVIQQQFERLERQSLETDLGRIENALRAEESSLSTQVETWAKWDETYDFMATGSRDYVAENLSFAALSSLKVQHVLIYNIDGELIKAVSMDYERELTESVSSSLIEILNKAQHLTKYHGTNKHAGGIFVAEGINYLIAASSIQDNTLTKPVRGTMVFTKQLSDELVRALADRTQLKLQLHVASQIGPAMQIELDGQQLISSERTALLRIGHSQILGGLVLEDIFGRPAISFSVLKPRAIFQQGLRTRDMVLYIAAAGGAIAVLAVVIMLHVVVRRRIRRFEEQLRQIATLRGGGARMSVKGTDELDDFARNVNVVLDALEEAKSEAVAANEAKSLFVASVSHELRTPLHGIIGMLNILLKREKNEDQRDRLKMAWEAACRLRFIIDDLLDLAKIEAGKLELDMKETSLAHVIGGALVAIAPRGFEKGVEVFARFDPNVPNNFRGDALRLGQVLINLLGNGAKFTNSGAVWCDVEYAEKDHQSGILTIRVRDTGIGIPESKLKHIFEAYAQAEASTATSFGGTGLGLSISQQLVSIMMGRISVSSTPGVGTEFAITLPIELTKSHSPAAYRLTSREVLVAMVNPTFAKALAEEVQRYGGSPHIIEHPDDIFVLASEGGFHPFDNLILDGDLLENLHPEDRSRLVEKLPGLARQSICLVSPMQSFLHDNVGEQSSMKTLLRPVITSDVIRVMIGEEVKAARMQQQDKAPEMRKGRPLKILVADDSRTNRVILEEMLGEFGHEVISVTNGQQLADLHAIFLAAAQVTGRALCDVVITDIEMPGLDGIAATRLMRSNEEAISGGTLKVPIVALTAHALSDSRERFLAEGMTEVITKPIVPTELFSTLQSMATDNSASDSVASASVDSVLDIHDLVRRSSGLLQRILIRFAGFLEDSPTLVAQLAASWQEGDRDTTREIAHALKGVAYEVGGVKAARLLERLESQLYSLTPEQVSNLITLATREIVELSGLVRRIADTVESRIALADARGRGSEITIGGAS